MMVEFDVWLEGSNIPIRILLRRSPVGKIVNSALKIQCHVVKNALLQTAFSAIFPTGYRDIDCRSEETTPISTNFLRNSYHSIHIDLST